MLIRNGSLNSSASCGKTSPKPITAFAGLRRAENWKFQPQALAEFTSRGLLSDVQGKIASLLRPLRQEIGDAVVTRSYELRPWVVNGNPAVSISVFSRLLHKLDLRTYATRVREPQELVGLFVSDKTSTLKGEIIAIAGMLSHHRPRLRAITQRDEMRVLIEKAPDSELVVSVLAGRPPAYDYVAGSLGIILRTKDLTRFKISRQAAQKVLRIPPDKRAELVREITTALKETNLVNQAFNSGSHDSLFLSAADVGFDSRVEIGGKRVVEYSEKTILSELQRHRLCRQHPRFANDAPIRLALLNALRPGAVSEFLQQLCRKLLSLGFKSEIIAQKSVASLARQEMESAITILENQKPHLLLGVFPDEVGEDEEDWSAYQEFKSLTVGRGLPSQVIYQSTLSKRYAMGNVVLGVLRKTGNVPYVMAQALPFADLVVGIDIARRKKEKLAGSLNATAVTRIYFGNGEFLRYVIHDAPLEGETIPPQVLKRLFPMDVFKDKRVVIHRDGFFRGEEKAALQNWAKELNAQFHLVEVLKAGTPRLYASIGGKIEQPPKGSCFKLSSTQAFVVSAPPPFQGGTPQPLQVRSEPPFRIEEAINSVLSLTVLHYGSLLSPRLPVTLHFSDKIAYLALQGIKPKDLEGDVPFWL
jgi:Piwi domain